MRVLSKDILDDMTMDVRKTKVASLVSVGQSRMINAQQMKDGRIEIVNVHGSRSPLVLIRFDRIAIFVRQVVSIVIRLPLGDAGFYSSARHPSGKSARMVVPAIVFLGQLALAISCSAKFSSPNH